MPIQGVSHAILDMGSTDYIIHLTEAKVKIRIPIWYIEKFRSQVKKGEYWKVDAYLEKLE